VGSDPAPTNRRLPHVIHASLRVVAGAAGVQERTLQGFPARHNVAAHQVDQAQQSPSLGEAPFITKCFEDADCIGPPGAINSSGMPSGSVLYSLVKACSTSA